MAIPDEAVKLECGNDPCHVLLATGERIQGAQRRAATGAAYRRLRSTGSNSSKEAVSTIGPRRWRRPLRRQEVALVGGGNSAGQATVFLAARGEVTLIATAAAKRDHVAISGRADRGLPNVEVVIGCEISSLDGKPGELEAVTVRERSSGRDLKFRRALPLLLHRGRTQHRLAAEAPASSSTIAGSY
jgi:thioredoxin reductase (NADPH)